VTTFYSRVERKTKRIFLRNSNSGPFLSGDLFKQKADLNITDSWMNHPRKNHEALSNANVIFCKSDLLQDFLNQFGAKVRAKVLICGNSDFDFNTSPESMPESVRLCLLQNLNFESDFFKLLPIGLENLSLAVNGFTKFYQDPSQPTTRLNKVLAGPFAPTHAEREYLLYEYASDSKFDFLNTRLDPKEYQAKLGLYKFVLCPRGNGIDTHRFWETLYKGNLPVIVDSVWSSHLNPLGIPFVSTSNLNIEFQRRSESNSPPLDPRRIETLWWPYWKKLITSYF
jgi:hypothetical protein